MGEKFVRLPRFLIGEDLSICVQTRGQVSGPADSVLPLPEQPAPGHRGAGSSAPSLCPATPQTWCWQRSVGCRGIHGDPVQSPRPTEEGKWMPD